MNVKMDLMFFGGLFVGVGIAAPYLPIKVIAFAVAALFAWLLHREPRGAQKTPQAERD